MRRRVILYWLAEEQTQLDTTHFSFLDMFDRSNAQYPPSTSNVKLLFEEAGSLGTTGFS